MNIKEAKEILKTSTHYSIRREAGFYIECHEKAERILVKNIKTISKALNTVKPGFLSIEVSHKMANVLNEALEQWKRES